MSDQIVISDHSTGEVLEKINLSELNPLFDPNHEHQFVDDPSDETNDFRAQTCSVERCGIWRLIAKR